MTSGSRNTWEGGKEGMRPPKSHLTQIDCSPLCQSQLLAQTATAMCARVYLCVCVWAETLIISPPDSVQGVYCTIGYCMLSQVSLLSLFLIFKCLYLDSDENREVTSAYPVSRQALGHVQNHCGLVLLHFLNWNHLVREKERQEDKRWDLRIDPKLKNKTKKQQ